MLKPTQWLTSTMVAGAMLLSRAALVRGTGQVHLVSRLVGREVLSQTVRIGDLNGDGTPDILFVQELYGPRIITCPTDGRHFLT